MNVIEITDISAPELDVYARLNEPQLRHFYEPHGGIFIGESPNVILRALNAGYEPLSLLLERRHIAGAAKEVVTRCGEIPVYTAELPVLKELTGFPLTRGVLCAMRRRPLPHPDEILRALPARIAVLEHVVNPTNVGAIFRSAAALGMDAVLLTPDSADPLSRRAIRVSMGTVFQIPWTELLEWPAGGISRLRERGYAIASMALSEHSVPVDDPRLKSEERLAIVLGTEGEGLTEETIAASDYVVRIPMLHGVDSLNVAAASAVAFWEMRMRGAREAHGCAEQ